MTVPQIFRVGRYTIFFWSNEGEPREPVHVHVAQRVGGHTTKIWITASGKCVLCNNDSRIPDRALVDLMRIIEARSDEIVSRWEHFFGSATYYC